MIMSKTTYQPIYHDETFYDELQIAKENAAAIFRPKFIPYHTRLIEYGLTDKEILLFGFIDYFTSNIEEKRRFYFTNAQLAYMLNCSGRLVSQAVQKLNKLGLIRTSYKMLPNKQQVRFIEGGVAKSARGVAESARGGSRKRTSNKNNINNNIDQNSKLNTDLDTKFSEFWELYSYKVGKKKCYSRYAKLISKHKQIIAGVHKYNMWRAELQRAGEFVPEKKHPYTWLNGEHWDDEYPGVENKEKTNINGNPIF